jgi:hypothetical protein
VIFKKAGKYYAVSECGRYTIARYYAGPESTYMSFRGQTFLAANTFQHEYDAAGVELPTYPARLAAYKAAVKACEDDAAGVAHE